MKLSAMQARSNRYLVYEHSAGATSWNDAEVRKVAAMDSVQKVQFDPCMLCLKMRDERSNELKPVRKRTTIVTNAPEIARRLD